MISRLSRLFGLICLLVPTVNASAQTPEASKMRDGSGLIAGANVYFGQGWKVEDSSPGMATLFSGEVGYSFALSPWNRMDAGVEIGTGSFQFKVRGGGAKVTLPLDYFMMARGGYGYTMGEKLMGMIKIGAGTASGSSKSKVAGVTTTEDVSGFMGALGLDLLYPASDNVRLNAGIDMKYLNLSGDNVDGFQLNAPTAHLGLHYAF